MRYAISILWLALLGSAIALSVLAAGRETLPGDVEIASWAQDQPFPGQRFSEFVRAVTTTQVCLVVGAGAVVALALLRRWPEAAALAIALIGLSIMQPVLKELVDRPRPVEPLVELRAGYTSESFPAGHVMSPTVVYGVLLWYAVRPTVPSIVRVGVAVWSAFVLAFAAPPNVWLGVHWPSDVLGGWAWALVIVVPLAYGIEALTRRLRGAHPSLRSRAGSGSLSLSSHR
ncbi:MAG: phosphatase PAP2 family protein [Dehalococcoidia bacterium]